MVDKNSAIVWLRQDLRLDDNPALRAAATKNLRLIPVYIWSPNEEGEWPQGAASRWWLHQSLQDLSGKLQTKNSRLILRRGNALSELRRLIAETGASHVFWNRRYEPEIIERDKNIKLALRSDGIEVETFNSALLFEPWELKTTSGSAFKVFTPFYRACLQKPEPPLPFEAAEIFSPPKTWPASLELSELRLEPKINWAAGFRSAWTPGEAGGEQELASFLKLGVGRYEERRNIPGEAGTSRFSPYLHFGELSPRRVWHELMKRRQLARSEGSRKSIETFQREIIWREFAYHLLFHFPNTPLEPLRPEFSKLPWRKDGAMLKAWQKGQTGYPIVDAGMRELWATGWMHNRVRMVVASFLVKDLLIPWQEGARWFWDTLVDADLANNTLGWQWTAGCGADAAPFFRIFNPVTQGERFDLEGNYVRRWCPELSKLPDEYIHAPWQAPEAVLAQAGVRLGVNYPHPLVDHAEARETALEAFETLSTRKIQPATRSKRKSGGSEEIASH